MLANIRAKVTTTASIRHPDMLEHGKFKLSVQDNIVVIELFDAFNQHAANHAIDELKTLCQRFPDGFYLLEIAEEYSGATPEVLAIMNGFTRWLNQHNCIARAMVFPDTTLLKIANLYEADLFNTNLPTQHFSTTQQAQQWIEQLKNTGTDKNKP